MIASTFVATTSAEDGSRTGALGNEPANGFFEGSDIFAIYHDDGTNDTSFTIDETVHVNITTNRVVDEQGTNTLRVSDYTGNQIIDTDPAFTQTDAVGPGYSYEASFVVDNANFVADHYLLEVEVEDNDGEIFRTLDTLIVGGGDTPAKYIKTFTDDDFTIEGWSFADDDIVYIEIWGDGATLEKRDCDLFFADYQDNDHRRNLNQLDNNSIDVVGNYIHIAYDLANDLNQGNVVYEGGWWYTITIILVDDGGNDVIVDWTVQIYINDFPVPTDVIAFPAQVDRVGAATTSIYGHFEDIDAVGVDDFNVTISVREPDDLTEVVLVDAQTNGNGGLTVTSLGSGMYNASYSWDPGVTQTLGLYDLQMTVQDTLGTGGSSIYDDNQDELEIIDTTINPPVIVAGNTTAVPDVVSRSGTITTVISSNFTDTDDDGVDEFVVNFTVRDEGAAVVILVDSATDGDAGEFGGVVDIVKTNPGEYTASYEWDPPDTVALGLYDLQFNVTDPMGGMAEDILDNNQNELELVEGDFDPVIVNVAAVPEQVDKMGANSVDIHVDFTDRDNHPLADFVVSVSVRDPDGTVIDIAVDVMDGGQGAFGETLTIVQGIGGYNATIAWDPPITAVVGLYDLEAEVTGPADDTGTSDFGDNPDELNVTSSDTPPIIIESDVTANPPVVARIGNGQTTIGAKFTDDPNVDASLYNITFRVRDIGNTIYVLVDDKADGGAGEFGGTVMIRRTGNHFTVSYNWNPPDDQPLGTYDLFFRVSDGVNQAEDGFGLNQEELEIIDVPSPIKFEIGNTRAVPDIVNRNGTMFTTLITNFTHTAITDVNEFRVSFMVRAPSGAIIVLADKKKDGDIGEGGGLVSIVNATNEFEARVTWDPPVGAELGTYDLHSIIHDPTIDAADGYGNNQEELTVVDEPVGLIKDVKANPDSVVVVGSETTTILVEFTDNSAPAISNFTISIWVRGPGGTEILLVNEKNSGGAGEFGNQLTVSGVSGDYTASYEWDPADDTVEGLYDLKAKVSTLTGWFDISDFGANGDELELVKPSVVGDPVLSDGSAKKDGDDHKFKVRYTNSMNVPPGPNGVVLVVAGQSYKMTEVDASDVNYSDGKDYYFLLELGKGKHPYHFEVTDGSGVQDSTDEKTIKVGGTDVVTADNTLLYALLAVMVIIIALMAVALALSRRKKGEPAMQYAPAAQEPVAEAKPVEPEKPAEPPKQEPPTSEGQKGPSGPGGTSGSDEPTPLPPPPPPSASD